MVDSPQQGRVCVVYTGGTIGMRSIDPELHPDQATMLSPDEVEAALRERSGLKIDYQFEPLLDHQGAPAPPLVSSEIGPTDWTQIAQTIKRHYDAYDGFVVLHGTDTMAWTASALSFMFGNLSKPIVLTGSQRPISAMPSDAVSNFVSSVTLAARADDAIPLIPEVVVCFGDLVLRGNRATKTSAASLQGFDTPNAPRLGRVGRRFDIDTEQVRPAPAYGDGCFVRSRLEPDVVDVALYPGMPAPLLKSVLGGNAGAVLRTFGAGNAPGGAELRHVLHEAAAAGMVLVNVTQTGEGTVEAGMLTGSRALTDCGVLSGLDLTAEAAFTKLMVLLGSEAPDVAAQHMQLDQRGEQSMDLVELRVGSRELDQDGVSRLVLTPSLHARVRPDRLASAVLRLSATPRHGDVEQAMVALHLNHWRADHATEPDVRSLGTGALRRTTGASQRRIQVVDVTAVCRQVLATGAPVTLTVVPSTPAALVDFDVVLSLFMERVVTEIA